MPQSIKRGLCTEEKIGERLAQLLLASRFLLLPCDTHTRSVSSASQEEDDLRRREENIAEKINVSLARFVD